MLLSSQARDESSELVRIPSPHIGMQTVGLSWVVVQENKGFIVQLLKQPS